MLLNRFEVKVKVVREIELTVFVDCETEAQARENFLQRCQDSKKLMPSFLPEIILSNYELSEDEIEKVQTTQLELFRDFLWEHVQNLPKDV